MGVKSIVPWAWVFFVACSAEPEASEAQVSEELTQSSVPYFEFSEEQNPESYRQGVTQSKSRDSLENGWAEPTETAVSDLCPSRVVVDYRNGELQALKCDGGYFSTAFARPVKDQWGPPEGIYGENRSIFLEKYGRRMRWGNLSTPYIVDHVIRMVGSFLIHDIPDSVKKVGANSRYTWGCAGLRKSDMQRLKLFLDGDNHSPIPLIIHVFR